MDIYSVEWTSGGQDGVDHAFLATAFARGLKTGGEAPKGWLTTQGPQKEAMRALGMTECQVGGTYGERYAGRTLANVLKAHVVIIIGRGSAGSNLTRRIAEGQRMPHLWLYWEGGHYAVDGFGSVSEDLAVDIVVEFLLEHDPPVVMGAGNRERGNPGIHSATVSLMNKVFAKLEALDD